MDKLTYYDTIANLIPGIVLLGLIRFHISIIGLNVDFSFLENVFIGSVIFIVFCYVLGHVIQFLSKYSVEIIIKGLFWKGKFFSDIFLIKDFKNCPESEFSKYVQYADDKLGFSKEELNYLTSKIDTKEKKNKAAEISRSIYRIIDSRSIDEDKAKKAHIQNSFYSMFRNLSAVFLILLIVGICLINIENISLHTSISLLLIFDFVMFSIFLLRAKERGELYIRGLFWSYFIKI